ncbi:MAG: DUF3795 domain-containing protein [Candidatus Thorarchaeota archaeon]
MSSKSEMIAPCGLYCAECPSYTGIIPDLARDLRKALRVYRYDKISSALAELPFFKEFKDYENAYEVMGALVKMRCSKGCRSGGGNPFCNMKKCTERKGFEGCWECDAIKSCKKLNELNSTHGEAHRKNLRKLKTKGVDEFLAGKKHWWVTPKKK